MKLSNTEKGYMDTQLPPIIIGVIIVVGLTNFISNPEKASKVPDLVHYCAAGAAFLLFAFGFYANRESLKCPESPFNRHISPLVLGLASSGSLIFSIWKLYNTPYTMIATVFCMMLVLIIITVFVLQFVRK